MSGRLSAALSRLLYAHPRGRLGLLLGPAVAWLLVFYVVALALLLLTSLWQQDVFTAQIVRDWTTGNYSKLLSGQDGLWLRIFGRTVLLAAIVTAIDVAIAFPLAWFMARVIAPRWRTLAFLAVVVPLWSSILVRIFAWRTILGGQGVLNTLLIDSGLLDQPSSAFLYNQTAIVITWANVWLPFMVLPIYTALEKIPDSYLEASRDLGASSWRTFRTVVVPLALPGVVAGAIFVFALTMGDFVAPQLVGGGSQVLGGAIKDRFGVAADYPFGAALASLTLVTLMAFLFVSRRSGAMENL
ncbi:MAG: putative spermidine/putrescine transport system permease protein [Solirubrobacteraceae bacterium]|jgi:putative spermidine/putrescine transport system permease protein|nr:putative spermidine/putrescine transport system permease protein [Solirubrobacteraceae bacterium]